MAKQLTDNKPRWYAIHTYAGYENAVVRNLRQRVESLGMEDKIFDVMVPMKKVIKMKRGKRIAEDEKVYPGYILVNMIVNDDSWYVVRNTPRVTGFVGTGVHPTPLEKKEIDELFKKMESNDVELTIDLQISDSVVIIDGPFKDLEGKIGGIDNSKGKIKIMIPMFGRETPVELDFTQIKKI